MCGRFVHFRKWADLRQTLSLTSAVDLPPNFNVAPTQQVPVVRAGAVGLEAVVMRWGFLPSWAKDKKLMQINARADTAAAKPMFRAAFKKRHCLILADGFYEWKKVGKAKQPYFYRLRDDQPFTFAGLWETWPGGDEPADTCAILTTDANELARAVHDRMPVILNGPDALAWVDPSTPADRLVHLLRPFPAEAMTAHPVMPPPQIRSVQDLSDKMPG